MAKLLAELVRAPTVLGRETPGQEVMRRAFVAMGLEPFDVPLDAAALERHPGGAPFSWDVAGKTNVLATWEPAEPGRRPLADPQRPHRHRQPGADRAVDGRPVRRPRRRRVDVRPRRGRHEVRARGDGRGGARPDAPGSDAARPDPAPVGRRGGVHGQRRARVRAGRPHGRRRDPHRADARGDLDGAGRRAVVPGARARRARARRRRAGRRQRDRGVVRGDRGAARARGRAERHQAAALRRLSSTRSTSTWG